MKLKIKMLLSLAVVYAMYMTVIQLAWMHFIGSLWRVVVILVAFVIGCIFHGIILKASGEVIDSSDSVLVGQLASVAHASLYALVMFGIPLTIAQLF